ncbi:PREDICTED: uncharacterized protein LOC105453608 [Wasmannia auropunctata]|uniref:uncharacterized protein LOC105453608 n=1 Tax=Wasmannia auropunctata TaxID=64793 RepID=UPI0005EFFEC1|nr:PREDICTED: uncharacterized protein LOC105453608 [Wasmannia auropunctata]
MSNEKIAESHALGELVSDYKNPAIKWHQTDITVVICIQLTDVSDYYLRIEDNCLQFSTQTNGEKYYLVLHLFGSVVAEKTVHKNVGRVIKIYLVKGLKWFPWLRLTQTKEKSSLILYNPDYIHDPDIYDPDYIYKTNPIQQPYDTERFPRYKREHKIDYILPDVPSSDEEESEDEYDIDFFA